MQHDAVYTDGVRIGITKHADKRVRQRMGLRRSAVPRTIRAAYERGIPVKGVDDLPEGYVGADLRQLNGFVFVFLANPDGISCVTVLRDHVEGDEQRQRRAREMQAERRDRLRRYRRHAVAQRTRSRNVEASRFRGW